MKRTNSNETVSRTKVVFDPYCAKFLLAQGFELVNIKKHKYDSTQTVFVFAAENDRDEEIDAYIEDFKSQN